MTSLFKFRLAFVGMAQTWSNEPLTQPLSLLITSSDSSYYFQSLFEGRVGEAEKASVWTSSAATSVRARPWGPQTPYFRVA